MQTLTLTDLPKRLAGETDKVYWRRAGAWVRGDDVRSKGDLRGWATCIFHLSNEVATRERTNGKNYSAGDQAF